MKERPILFSDAMVRAILAGTKTQTRRVVRETSRGSLAILTKWSLDPMCGAITVSNQGAVGVEWGNGTAAPLLFSPYGALGDRLWVRETFALSQSDPEDVELSAREPGGWDPPVYRADDSGGEWTRWDGHRHVATKPPWRPSIHMPRWASRLMLEVTSVRIERLRSIGGADALAEGITIPVTPDGRRLIALTDPGVRAGLPADWRLGRPLTDDEYFRALYAGLWDSINGARPGCSWADDPWVWVVSFKRIAP